MKAATYFKPMKHISLTEKLIVYFVVLCILSIGFVSFFSYRNASKAIIDRTFDQLISIREVKKNRVENFFNDRINDLKLLASSSIIKQQLKNNTTGDLFTTDQTGKNLFDYIVANNFYTCIFIGKTAQNYAIYPALEYKSYFTPAPGAPDELALVIPKISKAKKLLTGAPNIKLLFPIWKQKTKKELTNFII